jgi:hypothetical protein
MLTRDRPALALFFGALVLYGLTWRVGFLINDSLAIANTLVNVADGRLEVVRFQYGFSPRVQPGLFVSEGRLYGRNYGQVVAALPVLWLLEGLSLVADPRIALAALWTLAVLAFGRQVAHLVGRPVRGTVLTCVAAAALFAVTVLTATPLPERLLALVALQVSAMLFTAGAAVVCYRLLARFHGPRVGLAAGVALAVATPMGVWAAVPKRHVLTAALALVALYGFAVSRERTDRLGLAARALAYACVGLTAWVNVLESLVLFAVLVPLDLATAPEYRPRRLALLGAVFFLAFIPFFLTNFLISGNPVKPPRLLDVPQFGGGGGGGTPTTTTGTEATPDPGGGGGTPDGGGAPTPVDSRPSSYSGGADGPLSILLTGLGVFVGFFSEGAAALTDDPARLFDVFGRSGWTPGVRYAVNEYEAIELTILESTPLLAALLAAPVLAVRRLRAGAVRAGLTSTRRQVDAFALAYVALFVLVYLPRLPLHTQITVRYLLPIVPMGVYGVARLGAVRATIAQAGRRAAIALVGGTVVSLALVVGVRRALSLAVGEAMQFHALVALAAGTLLAAWGTADRDPDRGAVVLGFAAGVGVALVVLVDLGYLTYGEPALGVARLLADALGGA